MKTILGTWIYLLLVISGGAWALGFQTAWWQRGLAVLVVLALAAVDAAHTAAVVSELRERTADGLESLSMWIRGPLAIAGGAWLTDFTLDASGRATLAAAVVTVLLFERSMSAPPAARTAR